MSGDGRVEVREWLSKLEPPPRAVDWSIFAAVCFEVASGFVSFTAGTPDWAPLFWAHRAVGLSLIVLLAFKLARVRHRLTDPDLWRPSTPLSVLTALAAFGTIGLGILWVLGVSPSFPFVSALTVHAGLGVLLFVLMVAHLATRYRPPRRVDFDRRRSTLQYSVLLVAGAVGYRGQELLNGLLRTPGDDRRFTGSQPREGSGNASFPVTSWVADDPDPIDREDWTLTVRGAVESPLALSYEAVSPGTERTAVLDCTGGWYAERDWQGVSVDSILDAAAVTDDARYVRFVSVTGYRWSLPIDEARDALLATHVGGERLSHGHGAPLRLVAPGRRGFQWVKWVERIDVRRRGDPAQWVVTLVSGFD